MAATATSNVTASFATVLETLSCVVRA